MCSLVGDAYHTDTFLELMLSKDGLYHIKSSRRRVRVQEPQPRTTLHDLLSRAATRAGHLSRKDRRRLAFILANAMLHLQNSMWLDDTWSKNDVCFMQSVERGIDITRPYLASTFGTTVVVQPTQSSGHLHDCPPLLSLGITLLEIGLTEPIEGLRDPSDLVMVTSASTAISSQRIEFLKNLTASLNLTTAQPYERVLIADTHRETLILVTKLSACGCTRALWRPWRRSCFATGKSNQKICGPTNRFAHSSTGPMSQKSTRIVVRTGGWPWQGLGNVC